MSHFEKLPDLWAEVGGRDTQLIAAFLKAEALVFDWLTERLMQRYKTSNATTAGIAKELKNKYLLRLAVFPNLIVDILAKLLQMRNKESELSRTDMELIAFHGISNCARSRIEVLC